MILQFIDFVRLADIFAIPMFIWLIYYFYKKQNKTNEEYILYFFVVCGFFIDLLFTLNYINYL